MAKCGGGGVVSDCYLGMGLQRKYGGLVKEVLGRE